MPAGAYQRLTVIRHKDGKPRNNIMLIQKTGYANIWYNNRHIYWDYTKKNANSNSFDFDKIVQNHNQTQDKQKKRIIIVRRG